MGWSTWNTFACNISADLIKEMADILVSSGLKDAGYKYVRPPLFPATATITTPHPQLLVPR